MNRESERSSSNMTMVPSTSPRYYRAINPPLTPSSERRDLNDSHPLRGVGRNNSNPSSGYGGHETSKNQRT
jgi:hypothetical protein